MAENVGWINCYLKDILSVKNGYAFKSTEYLEEGVPIIRISDINDGIVDIENSKCIKESSEFVPYTVEKGDILIAMSGATTGKFGIYINDAVAYQNQRVGNLKPHSEGLLFKKFIYFLLFSLKRRIEKDAYGGAQPNISSGKIESIEISFPPLPEQRAIVAKIEQLFSELDNGIANLKTALEQLKVYRQAVLKKAFEGELTKAWRAKQKDLPTAEELTEYIKSIRLQKLKAEGKKAKSIVSLEREINKANLPPVPTSGWCYCFLAFAGDLGRGKSKHRPRNDKRLFGGDYPFIQTAEVKAQDVISNYTQTYNEFGLAQSKLWPKGTLCITIAANIAETGFLGIDACFPDSIVGFTPYREIVDPKFINYFFQSAKRRIEAYAPATAQKNINLTTLENLVIPFCSLQEQNQIVQEIESRLSVCDKVEETIKDSLEKAEALRQSIMKKAFEGKLLTEQELEACRQQPDWEPAEKLLERIKKEGGKAARKSKKAQTAEVL